ncbi:hypothetical protein D3C80_2187620 [compost metagenome]
MGGARAFFSSSNNSNTLSSAATWSSGLYCGARKAMPPTSRDDSDSVRTAKPLAPASTSMPLAFQNRVLSLI